MNRFFKETYRLINNDTWYLLLPRSALLLFFGWIVLVRPALSLKLCAWLLFVPVFMVLLTVFQRTAAPVRHLVWALPAAAAGALISGALETAGIWFAVFLCLLTTLRAGNQKTPGSRAAAGAAAAAALLLFFKSFTSSWFDLYPAVSLAFFATAAWESGNLKFLK